MEKLIKKIKTEKLGKVLESISLKMFNTYQIPSKVRMMVYPNNIDSLMKILKYIKDNNIKYLILGKGSNVIFSKDYYEMVIIKLDYLNDLKIDGTIVTVGSGYSLVKLSSKVAQLGLTGLEFASGIPGSIGGAVYMNAGAYKSDMGYVVRKVRVLTPELKVKTLYNKDLNFHYRTSFLKENKGNICLEATIRLKRGDVTKILLVNKERMKKRKETQPLEYPSAGSVFRNPENDYAGHLIEELGLKGYRINGAEVSLKHANFIVNRGKCKGKDVVRLINLIKEKVKDKYNVNLVVEQEIIE